MRWVHAETALRTSVLRYRDGHRHARARFRAVPMVAVQGRDQACLWRCTAEAGPERHATWTCRRPVWKLEPAAAATTSGDLHACSLAPPLCFAPSSAPTSRRATRRWPERATNDPRRERKRPTQPVGVTVILYGKQCRVETVTHLPSAAGRTSAQTRGVPLARPTARKARSQRKPRIESPEVTEDSGEDEVSMQEDDDDAGSSQEEDSSEGEYEMSEEDEEDTADDDGTNNVGTTQGGSTSTTRDTRARRCGRTVATKSQGRTVRGATWRAAKSIGTKEALCTSCRCCPLRRSDLTAFIAVRGIDLRLFK